MYRRCLFLLGPLLFVLVTLQAAAQTSADFEHTVVELVNQERRSNGAPPLKRNDLLDTSSGAHSDNMAVRDFFAHCDLDERTSPFERMTDAGYAWNSAGENIAAGASTPAAVVAGWMGSPGHRANILSSSFREIGVGYANQPGDARNVRRDTDGNCNVDVTTSGPYQHYWTQNFGRRNNIDPLVIDDEAAETDARDVGLYVYGPVSAQEMRFRNNGGAWSNWEPFSSERPWQLSQGNGSKIVDVEVRDTNDAVYSATDSILLMSLCMARDDQLDLQSQMVDFEMTFEACSLINAGNNFEVNAPGNVTFQAPRVVLGPGFIVSRGARFQASSAAP